MTTPSDNLDGDSQQSTGTDDQSFELPLPDEAANEARPLRRGLFGFKPSDVRTQISAKDAELAELRRDVAALWLAFGQHERTIRQVLETLERTSGVALDPPGGRGGQGQRGATASDPDPEREPEPGNDDSAATSIGAQLTDLDQVLAAIEEATQTLERGYSEGTGTTAAEAAVKVDDEIEPEPESEPKPNSGPS